MSEQTATETTADDERELAKGWLSAVFAQIDRVVEVMPDDHPLLSRPKQEQPR